MIPDWLWPCCTFILENDEERAIRRKNDEINRDLRRDKKDHRRQEHFQWIIIKKTFVEINPIYQPTYYGCKTRSPMGIKFT